MDPCNPKELIPRLERAGFRFSKSMGQNFVIEEWVPRTLAEASGCDADWAVMEIGPGAGALTRQLALRAGAVAAVELDERIIPVLRETTADFDNVSIILGDALKLDPETFAREKMDGRRRMVCANLPYNITSEIIEKLVYSGLFERMTFMIQREAAEKLTAQPGDKQWCLFAAKIQYLARAQIVCDVPPECFVPAPHVTSSIVRLDMLPEPAVAPGDEALFHRVLSGAFHLRRKTLLNSLAAAMSLNKDKLTTAMERAGIAPNIRGEALSLAQLAALSDALGELQ